jgi:hypothetical protein
MSAPLRKLAVPLSLVALVLAGVLAASASASGGAAPSPQMAHVGPGSRAPVLVELYTSEGCSSCPSADALLADWARRGEVEGVPVVVLGFHVDYWNQLGWEDRFSRSEWSERQKEANRAMGREDIFTPQVIVNGRASAGANEVGALLRAVSKESARPVAKVELVAKREEDGLSLSAAVIGAAPAAGEVAEVWAAVTESQLSTEVKRGENAGRKLYHAPVVRKLVRLGPLPASGTITATVPLEAGWRGERLRAVAFVQESNSRRVLGVAEATPRGTAMQGGPVGSPGQ